MGEEVNTTIEGIFLYSKMQFKNDQGHVYHFLKESDDHYSQISEVYFSYTNYGVVKGWKKHLEMDQNFVVPQGMMKFVFYDDRIHSKTKGALFEVVIGEDNYKLLKIPSNIWYSFSPVSKNGALITNATSILHRPDETLTLTLDNKSIPYSWTK